MLICVTVYTRLFHFVLIFITRTCAVFICISVYTAGIKRVSANINTHTHTHTHTYWLLTSQVFYLLFWFYTSLLDVSAGIESFRLHENLPWHTTYPKMQPFQLTNYSPGYICLHLPETTSPSFANLLRLTY